MSREETVRCDGCDQVQPGRGWSVELVSLGGPRRMDLCWECRRRLTAMWPRLARTLGAETEHPPEPATGAA